MSYNRSDLPLFYLRSEDDWPKSRRGVSFIAVMRDAAQRRFRDAPWPELASTYQFETPLPATPTTEPDVQAEVTDILEWHQPGIHIDRRPCNDADENAPSGVLVRHWTFYVLDDADWQRALDVETQCRTRSDVQLREFDRLLDSFAQAALVGTVSTFTVNESDRTMLPIPPEHWDVDLPVLRARHAHGRYDPNNVDSRSPHGGAAIFVQREGLGTWIASIAPISFDNPPDLALARKFLGELEKELKLAWDAHRKREGLETYNYGIPGGRKVLSTILKCPPFNLSGADSKSLINERPAEAVGIPAKSAVNSGRPGGTEITKPILNNLVIKYGGRPKG